MARNSCAAILWNSGKQCPNPKAPVGLYCPVHQAILAPTQPGEIMNDELALARFQIRQLLASKASPATVLEGLRLILNIVTLREYSGRSHQ